MSVILNALKSHKPQEKEGEPASANKATSFRRGMLRFPGQKKGTKILFAVFALVVVLTAGLKLRNAGVFHAHQKVAIKRKVLHRHAEPEDLGVTMEKAAALFGQNRLDESLQLYQQALDKNPHNAKIHNDMGLILLKKNLLVESEKHLSLATELDSMCAECHNNLGYLKTQQGENTKAEQCFKKAISLQASYADPYYNLGVLYEKNGDIRNAINAYQDFLRHFPDKESPVFLQVENRILVLQGR